MKKIFSFMIALLLLINFGCGLAEDAESIITWQGIPWESSLEETVQALISLGVITDENEMQHLEGAMPYHFPPLFDEEGIIIAREYEDEKSFNMEAKQIYTVLPTDYMIAGYNTQQISYAFAFDGTETALVSVIVVLECPAKMEEQDMAADLKVKCDQVYGEGSFDYDVPMYNSENTYENTYLYIVPDFSCVILCYGTGNGWSLIKKASSNFSAEEDNSSLSVHNDTTGL